MSAAESGNPHRGEVWWVAFDPSLGGEIKKTRPAIVVSNDAANRALNRVQLVPLTSNVQRLYPAEAYVSVSGARHKAMADQVTTACQRSSEIPPLGSFETAPSWLMEPRTFMRLMAFRIWA